MFLVCYLKFVVFFEMKSLVERVTKKKKKKSVYSVFILFIYFYGGDWRW